MNLDLSPAEQAFRGEVRDFIERNLPTELKRAQHFTTTVFAELDVTREWLRILHRRGWAAPTWPQEFGGTGWNIVERYIWQIECSRASAAMPSPIGLGLVGPVVMRFGTPEQQQRYLPAILSGEDYWCQGFSEPGAGSDLASLRTRAVLDGDQYIVNGTKIWTTHAHCANRMITLVRTSDVGKPQAGITFLMIDMDTPGIQVRPIMTIGGDHEVNQVFLDDVRVPVGNRIGDEGQGWSIAKYLLEFERGGSVASAGLRTGLAQVMALAEGKFAGLPSTVDDPAIAARIAEVAIDIDALEMIELRTNLALRSGQNPGAAASMLKLKASRLQQAVGELAVQVLGERALRWDAHRPLHMLAAGDGGEEELLPIMSRYLNNRAMSIFGGASEVQLGLIAKMSLGL